MPNVYEMSVEVTQTNDNRIIRNGEILKGIRVEGLYMANNIRNNYKYIGVGLCHNVKKPIKLYINNMELIYGLSTVLPYRYFILEKVR